MRELVLPADKAAIPQATAWIDAELEKLDCPIKTQMQIDLAVDEVLANIAMYAYPEGSGTVMMRFCCTDRTAEIAFIDSGIPYNPLENPEPDVTLPAEKRKIGGLGIFLVRKMADEVLYRREDGKNVLTVRKRI